MMYKNALLKYVISQDFFNEERKRLFFAILLRPYCFVERKGTKDDGKEERERGRLGWGIVERDLVLRN